MVLPQQYGHSTPAPFALARSAAERDDQRVATGYWIITFRSVTDQAKLDAYIAVAGRVLSAAGVRYIVRGVPVKVYEAGVQERTVVIEFESVAKAIEVYESAEYQNAMHALGDGAVRDVRVLEGYA